MEVSEKIRRDVRFKHGYFVGLQDALEALPEMFYAAGYARPEDYETSRDGLQKVFDNVKKMRDDAFTSLMADVREGTKNDE